jgi:two-component system, OmpR family, response regulator VicR
MKILVIEDDQGIIETIALTLQISWPEIMMVSTSEGLKGVDMAESESPDIIILDLGLPDINGYDVLRKIRAFSNIPIIILTAMTAENDIIRGLEWGADDYITKPFRKMEFLARIKTVLRRGTHDSDDTPVVCGMLRYVPATRQFYLRDKEVILTVTEADILSYLMKQSGQVVTHSAIAEAVWGDDYANSADTLKVHIRHLREKLEDDPSHPRYITTRPGTGYSLIVP